MEAPAIRLLIREKLKGGRLPYDSMPRFWGGPGNDEQCDACDAPISKPQLVLEGIASMPSNKKPIQFHVVCFQLWDHERREPKIGTTAAHACLSESGAVRPLADSEVFHSTSPRVEEPAADTGGIAGALRSRQRKVA